MSRTLIWYSQGAASAVAAKLALRQYPDAIVVHCDTGNEDEDNARFQADCIRWFNRPIEDIRSSEYRDVIDIWERRKFMSGRRGAPCSIEGKLVPRLAYQRPDDLHVFGYTCDSTDALRFARFKENFPELKVMAPLISAGITKAAALDLLLQAGISPPRTYAMGFPNANCLQTGCVRATSPDYWSLFRTVFPDRFAAQAARSRRIGARLCRINGERKFIDEIPEDWPTLDPIAPACDFMCALADIGGGT